MNEISQSQKTTIKSLINPEPITVKGIKTFHFALFHIYCGKNETIPKFQAVAEKSRGMGTALGAIFKKTTQLTVNKQWMGKVGSPQGLLRNDPNTIRTRTKIEINLDTIREKLAYDLFRELGRGLFLVPKTRLSLQPIFNDFTKSNALAQCWMQDGIKESLQIMSSFLDGYSDLAKASTQDGNATIPFMAYLKEHHRPPEMILSPENQLVPLKGMMGLLAVGRCLADVDLLGGGGCNAGFIWVKDKNQIIAAQIVKIDPGYAFRFNHDDENNASENFVINTHKKLGSCQYHLQDLKDLQTSTGNHDAIVRWNCLTDQQQDEFLSVLLNTSRYLRSEEVLDFLFYREGQFSYPNEAHSSTAYMPKELAEQMCHEMKTWIEWQIEIYDEPLKFFKTSHPEQLLRIYYIDQFGELPLPMTKETYPIQELFTELIIVERSNDTLKDLLPEVDSFKETTNRLGRVSETITLDKLFEHHRKVLLIGRAGIGKSTLCQKMAHDWASGKLWNNSFDVVFWISLRDLTEVIWHDSFDFLDTVIPHLFKEIPSHKDLYDPNKKILLILDGYDEAADFLANKIENFLATTDLHVLITSRPGKLDRITVDQVVENVGFSDSQIKIYIDQFLKRREKDVIHELKGGELFSIIKSSPQLYPIAHVPLQLQMILSLYDKTGHVQQATSLTSLYKSMVSELYDWHLRGEKQDEKLTHLLQLGKIATRGLQYGKLVIPHKKVKDLITDALLKTGILKQMTGEQPSYCFVHLTFQEYLTALYIHSKPLEKQTKFILEHRHRPSYQLVLAFLAGFHSQANEVEQFFDILSRKSYTMTLSPAYQMELTLRCLNECEGFNKPLESIENLVKECPQIWDTTLSDGYSPMLSAVNQNQSQAVYWLGNYYPPLLSKERPSVKNMMVNITPFLLCAEKGNIEAMKFLLKKDPSLTSSYTKDGFTPLHSAAFRGHIETMKFLLEKDPSLISCFTKDGITPLHPAASNGQIEAMKFLLEKDPSLISCFTKDGFTPLHRAAFNGHIEAMEFLLQKDPSLISCFMKDGFTTLHQAAFNGHIEAMEFLLEKDPSLISCFTESGGTPLHWAASNGHIEAVKFLLEKDPSLISCFMKYGTTPLHLAVESGSLEVGKWLFQQEPSLINRFNSNGKTALTIAKEKGKIEFAKWIESVGGKEKEEECILM